MRKELDKGALDRAADVLDEVAAKDDESDETVDKIERGNVTAVVDTEDVTLLSGGTAVALEEVALLRGGTAVALAEVALLSGGTTVVEDVLSGRDRIEPENESALGLRTPACAWKDLISWRCRSQR